MEVKAPLSTHPKGGGQGKKTLRGGPAGNPKPPKSSSLDPSGRHPSDLEIKFYSVGPSPTVRTVIGVLLLLS